MPRVRQNKDKEQNKYYTLCTACSEHMQWRIQLQRDREIYLKSQCPKKVENLASAVNCTQVVPSFLLGAHRVPHHFPPSQQPPLSKLYKTLYPKQLEGMAQDYMYIHEGRSQAGTLFYASTSKQISTFSGKDKGRYASLVYCTVVDVPSLDATRKRKRIISIQQASRGDTIG